MLRKLFLILFVLTLSFSFFGCKNPFDPEQEDKSPSFEGEQNPSNNSVYLEGEIISGNLLELKVNLKEITEDQVSGASFYLDFNSQILSYESYLPGNFLEQNSQVEYGVSFNPALDKLIVGISLKNSTAGVKGDGTLITINFRLVSKSRSNISFSNNELINLNDEVINNITWYGGVGIVQ